MLDVALVACGRVLCAPWVLKLGILYPFGLGWIGYVSCIPHHWHWYIGCVRCMSIPLGIYGPWVSNQLTASSFIVPFGLCAIYSQTHTKHIFSSPISWERINEIYSSTRCATAAAARFFLAAHWIVCLWRDDFYLFIFNLQRTIMNILWANRNQTWFTGI